MPVVPVNHFSSANDSNVVCRSLAKVLYSERMIPAPILEGKFGFFDVNISPQLPFGRLIRTSYEPDRSKPQHPSDQTEKPFSGSDTEKRDLRSTGESLMLLWVAIDIEPRVFEMISSLIPACAILRLVLCVDLRSLIE